MRRESRIHINIQPMRYGVLVLALLIVGVPTPNQKHRTVLPMPDHFVIARDTFFDFGPPFDYLDLLFVRPAANGSSVERILLTPPGDACTQPATVESTSVSVNKSPAELLGATNPCTIPEKELNRELKRRKHISVFSGINVVIQFQCGDQTRLVRSDILDRDIYLSHPDTPEHTSWTMKLLEQLDQAIGDRVGDKPIFPVLDKSEKVEQPKKGPDSPTLHDVSEGKYDSLFSGISIKASEVYRSAQTLPPPPIVHLIGALDVPPEGFSVPEYAVIAMMARVEGEVTFDFDIDENGVPTKIRNDIGPSLLKGAVVTAIKAWKFPKDASGKQIKVTFEFTLNCKRADHQ